MTAIDIIGMVIIGMIAVYFLYRSTWKKPKQCSGCHCSTPGCEKKPISMD